MAKLSHDSVKNQLTGIRKQCLLPVKIDSLESYLPEELLNQQRINRSNSNELSPTGQCAAAAFQQAISRVFASTETHRADAVSSNLHRSG
jgi:hypothetical protein